MSKITTEIKLYTAAAYMTRFFADAFWYESSSDFCTPGSGACTWTFEIDFCLTIIEF